MIVQAVKTMARVKQSDSRLLISALGPVGGWSVEVSTDASLCNLNDGVHSTGAYVILINHSTTPVEDKKLRRDISIIKQMLNEREISSVSWCPGKDQLADCMTKRTAPTFNLLSVFQSGRRQGQ